MPRRKHGTLPTPDSHEIGSPRPELGIRYVPREVASVSDHATCIDTGGVIPIASGLCAADGAHEALIPCGGRRGQILDSVLPVARGTPATDGLRAAGIARLTTDVEGAYAAYASDQLRSLDALAPEVT